MSVCNQCPRQCGADRENGKTGFCGCTDVVRVARVALHMWEEPSLSGKRGSGTIFFAGCNLRCVYCQNFEVSRAVKGRTISVYDLGERMLDLQQQGAHNINLVTPTHYVPQIIEALTRVRKRLYIPVVYNCGGYESLESIDALKGLVDIYLPDFKYVSSDLSAQYSGAKDYFTVAKAAILRMQEQVGKPVFSENGILQRGVIVRHLVLPGCRKDSIAVMQALAEMFDKEDVLVSLMSQYTPEFAKEAPFENLHRKVTSLEYESVVKELEKAGFNGYIQSRSAANTVYTPHFYGEDEEPPALIQE